MQQKARSLWEQLPSDLRLALIPIVATALLVEAGQETAELIVRLRDGIASDIPLPNPTPAYDLWGLFIVVNFGIVFWFGYRTLRDTVNSGTEIKLDAQLIGLASAFVTALQVYKYALKTAHPERMFYAGMLMFYAFFVPFVLMRGTWNLIEVENAASERRQIAIQAFLCLELLAFSLVPSISTIIVCSAYFSIFNDGIAVGGITILGSFVKDVLHHSERSEFWGFSPAILGIGWFEAVILLAKPMKRSPEVVEFELDRKGKYWVALATVAINLVLGLSLFSPEAVKGTANLLSVEVAKVEIVKGALSIALTAAFFAAVLAARQVRRAPR